MSTGKVKFMDIMIDHLTKAYGKFLALEHVSLEISQGMFGLLGPNGAGKTTFMKILATIYRPTSGQVYIDGLSLLREPGRVRQMLGYLPQDFGFFRNLSAIQMLDYIGTMKNIPGKERYRQIRDVLEQVNLQDHAAAKVGNYSGGMKQRLGIAQALLGNPKLLIVDEPTAGLDPEERIRFRNIITRILDNRTIILSTHIVGDIEASCNQVAVLNKGKISFVGTLSELRARANGKTWEVTINQQDFDAIEQHGYIISSKVVDQQMILRVVAQQNPLGKGLQIEPSLEDGYIAVIETQQSTRG